jgi:phasin family protein
MANDAMPQMDIRKLMEQFRMPGVDMDALMEGRRKDIEAVVAANRQAFEGMQLLAQRQGEMLREAMTEWQAASQELLKARDPGEIQTRQAELAKQALDRALANMRELAEMATRSQSQAWEVVNRRFHENLEELKRAMQPK